MQLLPLCVLQLTYTQLFVTGPLAGEELHMYGVLSGTAEGPRLNGRVDASNYPIGRADDVFMPHLRGVITLAEGALVEFELQGYGVRESERVEGRKVLGFGTLRTGAADHHWMNRVMVACEGVLNSPRPSEAAALSLTLYEAVWEEAATGNQGPIPTHTTEGTT